MSNLIIGSGGSGGKGGGGGGSPTEARDNLDSKQFAKVLDLLSEGEIGGLVNGAKSIFINNVQLQNDDNSYNFADVSWESRNGTSSQSVIPLTENTATTKSTGFSVVGKTDTRVVQITDSDVDAVKVIISVPSLQRLTDEGDIYGTEIELKIEVQYQGGSYATKVSGNEGKITGRTGDLYQKEYLIRLDGTFPVNVKVSRITDDSTSSKLANAFKWENYVEITYDQRAYANSALVGMRVDAEQFTSIPSRKYLVKGIKVKVPHTATVRADGSLSYSGTFNGTLGAAVVTNDPAWILYDLLTTSRYGLGDHLAEADLDKFSFYAASQYCSELIDDCTGTGGQEPRFTCNVNIQSAAEAYTVINQLCSIFRAQAYWSAGSVALTQDSPADTSYLFSIANVLEPGFTYSTSSQKNRTTVAIVKYFDNDLRDYAYEEVKDTTNMARYGSVVRNINAFATTSRGQALRLGKWLLYMENSERSTCSFVTSIDAGVVCRPGQVIEIADEMIAGSRRSGRIKASPTPTTTAIPLDDDTGLNVFNSPTLSVILPDGSFETKNVSSISSGVVTVSSAFSSAPNPNSVWVYQTSDLETSTWRVISVEEQDGSNYAVSCLEYNSSKYSHVESGNTLTTRDITNLNEPPAAPSGLSGLETIYENTGIARVKIILTWTSNTDNVFLRWRYEDGNWESRTVEGTRQYEILDTVAGNYTIECYAVSASGLRSTAPAQLTPFVAAGKTAAPTQVTGISLLPIDEASAILSWTRSTELDVLLGGQVLIRHSELTSGAQWSTAQEIVVAASGNQTQKQVPLLTGTYLLKFRDDLGNESPTPGTNDSDWNDTRVTIDLPEPSERLIVQTVDEHTANFAGTKNNTIYDSSLDALKLTESSGAVSSTGDYLFNNSVDLTQVYDVNIKRNMRSSSFDLGSLWDSRTSLIDTWGYIDSTGVASADKCNVTLYVRATNDNPSSSPTWGSWREFSNVLVRGRGFQFKAVLSSTDTNQNISVTQLGAQIKLQGRTESISTPIATGSSTYTVAFANAFKVAPNVVITQTNQQSGDFYELSNISRTGFQVLFKNGTSAVARYFVWAAAGFGKEIT